MKKWFTLFLAMVLLLGMNTVSFAEEPVVITVAVADQTNVEDFNTNWTTLYVEKALNVDLQFRVYASADYANKINLMIQAGEKLEDIVLDNFFFSDAMIYEWAQEGAVLPLNEYFYDEEVSPNLTEAYERVGKDFRPDIIMPDGNIYYIPVFNLSYGNEYRNKIWYYNNWLEALNAEVPSTLDELCDLLRQVVVTDLNGNGIADEIGLAGDSGIKGAWFSYLMNSFVYYDYNNNFMKVEDGKVSFSYTEEAFRDGVEYIAAMLDEGLIAKESLTQNGDSWRAMVNTADHTTFLVPFTTPSRIMNNEIKTNYLCMAPVEGPEGVRYAQYNPSAAIPGMFISSTCENPEMAFRVGDLLCCELLTITNRWGLEGEDWDYVANTADPSMYVGNYEPFGAFIIVYDDATFWSSGGMQNKSWMQAGPYVRQYGMAGGRSTVVGNQNPYDLHVAQGDTMYQTGGFAPEEVIVKLTYSAEETEIVTKISNDLNTYVIETVTAWLMDASTLTDDAWDTFLANVEELGASEWLEVAQASYDRAK